MLLMALLYPIAFPIAMLLDCLLGKGHSTFFRRAGVQYCCPVTVFFYLLLPLLSLSLSSPPYLPELQELVKLHGDRSHENEEPLTDDEVLIVKVTNPSCYNCGLRSH